MRPDPQTIAHEAVHLAAASLLGLEVEPVQWGSAVFDGFLGQVRLTDAARQELVGTYGDRLRYATVAMLPSVAIFRAEGCESDMALIEAMRPTGYSRELWGWLVGQNARRLFLSEEFDRALAEAAARINQQMASA